MPNGWRQVRLGDVVARRKEPVRVIDEPAYTLMGIRWRHLGAYQRGDHVTSPARASTMFRMREGDFVFNRIDTDKGAVAVVGSDLDGALASNEFPAYRCAEQHLLPAYLWLHFQLPSVQRQLRGSGSEGRARWRESDFENHLLVIPPVADQRRIVHLIGTLEQAEQRARGVLDAALILRDQVCMWLADASDDAPLADLADIQFGRAFESSRFSDTGEARLLRGDNVSIGDLRWEGVRYWPSIDARDSAFQLEAGDVVIGMDRPVISAGVRVALVEKSDLPALLVQRVARVRLHQGLNARALVSLLGSAQVAAMFVNGQTGAFVPHLAAKDIRELRVPIHAVRGPHAETLTQIHSLGVRGRQHLQGLGRLKETLLSALLSGEHEIAESYDELMEVAS